ncbi:hypothetical protein [Rubrivirga sp. IMCC43871]|uniref:hypothetical protein n=1 Tax=Rubrivirga sp. IMCC43871 TaxID=3391575 RepID=UPI00398FA8A9
MDLARIARVLAVVALVVGAVVVGVSIARDGLPGDVVGWILIAGGLSGWSRMARKPPRDGDEPGS